VKYPHTAASQNFGDLENQLSLHVEEHQQSNNKNGSPMHVAPTCVGPGKGPTTLGLTYASFPCTSTRGYFHDLNPWPHGHKATVLLLRQGSPSISSQTIRRNKKFYLQKQSRIKYTGNFSYKQWHIITMKYHGRASNFHFVGSKLGCEQGKNIKGHSLSLSVDLWYRNSNKPCIRKKSTKS
jgi:hypothetical protein